MPQALPSEVHWKHAEAVAGGDRLGEVAGSATGFEDTVEWALFHDRIEQAEQDLPHASIPPEILLGAGNIGELGRIHPPTFIQGAGSVLQAILKSWALQSD